MNYTGNIQSWQIDQVTDFPMMAKVSTDIVDCIWSKPNVPDGLSNFVSCMKQDIVLRGRINWDECPDENFRLIWMHKQRCLFELYSVISNIHAMSVPNTFFSELYNEKYEQALDYVLDDTETAPLLSNDKRADADAILVKRAEWGKTMRMLEDYRVVGRDRILSATTVAIAGSALDVILEQLVEEVQ